MTVEKPEYQRVERPIDDHKRILVRFAPRIRGGSRFSLEFAPLQNTYETAKIFVADIDTANTFALQRWSYRYDDLAGCGTLPTEEEIQRYGITVPAGGDRDPNHDPRTISQVKRVYTRIEAEYNEDAAYLYNYFLASGELASPPLANEDFCIDDLKNYVEDFEYCGLNAEGNEVTRSLEKHLLDTYKTQYVEANICRFLKTMCEEGEEMYGEEMKKQR